MVPTDLKLVQTCDYCPEQYDVFNGDERIGYIRHRSGVFTCQPVMSGELLWIDLVCRTDESWGSIPDDKREEWLNECKNVLADFWNTHRPDEFPIEKSNMRDNGEVVIPSDVVDRLIEVVNDETKHHFVVEGNTLCRVLNEIRGGR